MQTETTAILKKPLIIGRLLTCKMQTVIIMWCKDYSLQDKNRMVTSEINDRKNEGIKLVHGVYNNEVLTRIKENKHSC